MLAKRDTAGLHPQLKMFRNLDYFFFFQMLLSEGRRWMPEEGLCQDQLSLCLLGVRD